MSALHEHDRRTTPLRQVLATNHVFDILLKAMESEGDLQKVQHTSLPPRKRAGWTGGDDRAPANKKAHSDESAKRGGVGDVKAGDGTEKTIGKSVNATAGKSATKEDTSKIDQSDSKLQSSGVAAKYGGGQDGEAAKECATVEPGVVYGAVVKSAGSGDEVGVGN